MFGDRISCRSREIRIRWWSRGRALCLTGSLGPHRLRFQKKGKVSLILNLCPLLTNRPLERESRVEMLPSSPPVKNLSVDENREAGGPLSALLPSQNCADRNSLLKILIKSLKISHWLNFLLISSSYALPNSWASRNMCCSIKCNVQMSGTQDFPYWIRPWSHTAP